MNKYFELENISKNRNFIYGMTSLFIMIFHSYILWNVKIFDYIQNKFNVGVDIFLFLSAVSSFFSMKKNDNVLDFYKKRVKRVFLPAFIISFFWFSLVQTGSIGDFFYRIFFISFWTEGFKLQWFVSLILALYLIYPLLYKIIKKNKNYIIVLLIADIVLNYFLQNNFSIWFDKLEVALLRIPIFLIGCYCSVFIYEKKKIHKLPLGILFFVCLILIILDFNNAFNMPYNRYLYIPFSLCLIVIMTEFFEHTNKNKFIMKTFNFLGYISFENYLIYEKMILLLYYVIGILFYPYVLILSSVLTIFISYVLRTILDKK